MHRGQAVIHFGLTERKAPSMPLLRRTELPNTRRHRPISKHLKRLRTSNRPLPPKTAQLALALWSEACWATRSVTETERPLQPSPVRWAAGMLATKLPNEILRRRRVPTSTWIARACRCTRACCGAPYFRVSSRRRACFTSPHGPFSWSCLLLPSQRESTRHHLRATKAFLQA